MHIHVYKQLPGANLAKCDCNEKWIYREIDNVVTAKSSTQRPITDMVASEEVNGRNIDKPTVV